MTNRLLSTSSISNDNVVNASGEDLGEIKDLMVDPAANRIEYAVVSFGGFMGLGDKYFAIPFDRLTVDRENERMVLPIEKGRLENAPGFDKDDWPDFADPEFRKSIDDHYMAA